jgi:hypothetical protein
MKSFLPWLFAFLAFPLGGSLALLLSGPVTNPRNAAIGGLIAGLTVGLAQWLALRGIIAGIRPQWIIGTALGCSLGTALGQGIGPGTGHAVVFFRGLAAGLIIGLAQFLSWRADVPKPVFWIPLVGGAWALAWMTTKSVGVDLSKGYAVFGSSGALVFQGLTGTALYLLLKAE